MMFGCRCPECKRIVGDGERLSLEQAMQVTNLLLKDKFEVSLMKDMPSVKRRCLEERVIDVATDAIHHKVLQEARDRQLDLSGVWQGKVVDGYVAPALSQVKWQVIVYEEGMMHGEAWADLQDAWAGGCEDIFDLVSGWTDIMWSRVQDVDGAPQVVGAGLGFPDHVIEFHKGGAVQMNLKTNTRRSVRRVKVVMGSGKGTICKDPVNVFTLPGGGPAQLMPTALGEGGQVLDVP